MNTPESEIYRLSNGKQSHPSDKLTADGFCDICCKAIAPGSPNKFCCCEECRRAAYNYYYEKQSNDDR